jgi:hypothetical protein
MHVYVVMVMVGVVTFGLACTNSAFIFLCGVCVEGSQDGICYVVTGHASQTCR